MLLKSYNQDEIYIINLTIVECKSWLLTIGFVGTGYNKSNHSGM